MTVYFIRPIGMAGPVKIGMSGSPDQRRVTLETWSPFPLEIVCQLEGGYSLEQRFHAKFREQHTRREWFTWTPELELVMQSIIRGTFDISTLPQGHGGVRKKQISKDMSFATPAWRYERSVGHRIDLMRNGGLPWQHPGLQELRRFSAGNASGDALEAIKAIIEPKLAVLAAEFPPKAYRRRALPKVAA